MYNFQKYILKCFVVVITGLQIFSVQSQNLGSSNKPNRFVPFEIGSNINSSYSEVNPVFSIDEKTIYFSRIDHPENHYGDFRSQDIWFSTLQEDGSWSEASRLEAKFNDNRYNSSYGITNDGYFLVSGNYTKKGRYKGRGLSKVQQTADGWTLPQRVKVPKLSKQDKGLTSYAYINKEGDILLLSYSSKWLSAATNKIRYSEKKENGKWKKPKAIKNKQLAKKFKSIESPYLSDDGLTIYFSAFGKKSGENYENDIYTISRKDVGSSAWDNPVKVSDTVNTDNWENYYKRFNNGVWAVFNKSSVGDDSDIFIVKLYEPKPYIDVKGTVLLDDKPFKGDFGIMINNALVDSVRINPDSSTYAVQLPLGSKYELRANSDEMEAKIEVIDATYDLEYQAVEKNLELSLLPFLDLSGSVTVNGDLLKEPFTVLINGMEVDSLITNSQDGTYSVKLPLGNKYNLEVKSGNYIPEKAIVDVSMESKQIRIGKDLKLTAIPYVDIGGQILNTETNAVIDSQIKPKIMVNGVVVDSILVVDGKYKSRLNWGRKYNIQAQVDNFGSKVEIVDLTNVKNYKDILLDLGVTPLKKYATITGKVLNMKTGLPLSSNYEIEVNGARSPNSRVFITQGTYEVKINLGEKVDLTASAQNYFPISEFIDVSEETENVKIIKDLQMMPLEVGESILLNHIFFETASTNLKSESFADIDRVVDLLRVVPSLKIEISGYTDSSGKDSYNLSLSDSRAKSVAEYIWSQGISSDRVQHKGYGEASPVANNLTPEGRAKNRRVEFVVLKL